MSNFWRSFGQSLDLKPTANIISKFLLEDKNKESDNQQRQILQSLLSGTVTENPPQLGGQTIGQPNESLNNLEIPIDVTDRKVTKERPFTNQEKAGLLGALSDKNLNRYSKIDKTLNPDVEYKTFYGKTYKVNPDGSVDFTKPILEKPQKVEYKTIGDKTFLKNPDGSIDFTKLPAYIQPPKPKEETIRTIVRDGRRIKVNGYPDPNGDYEYKGKRYSGVKEVSAYEIKKLDDNNNEVFTKEYVKELNTDFRNLQDAQNDYDLLNDEGILTPAAQKIANNIMEKHKNDDSTKEDILAETFAIIKQNKKAAQETYLRKITRDMPATAKKWEKENLSPKDNDLTKWANIVDAYNNSEISHLDFQFLKRKFQAEYGYDPVKSLGVKLYGK